MKTYSLEEAIARMDRRMKLLSDTDRFFRLHAPEWRTRAKALVRIQGRMVKPDDINERVWEDFVSQLAERVNLLFVDGGGVDIDLRATSGMATETERLNLPITMADIEAWVEAGERGEEMGKHLDQRDAGKSTDQIVAAVFFAMRAGFITGKSIRAYLETEMGLSYGDLLGAILIAWVADLWPHIARQWRAWVRDIAALEER